MVDWRLGGITKFGQREVPFSLIPSAMGNFQPEANLLLKDAGGKPAIGLVFCGMGWTEM